MHINPISWRSVSCLTVTNTGAIVPVSAANGVVVSSNTVGKFPYTVSYTNAAVAAPAAADPNVGGTSGSAEGVLAFPVANTGIELNCPPGRTIASIVVRNGTAGTVIFTVSFFNTTI